MIKELEQKGYCKFKEVFPKKFIYELKIKCLEIAEGLSVELREKYKSQGSLVQLLDYPCFSKIIAESRLFDCFIKLGFKDTVFSSGYLISKPAGGPPLFWHQDWWGWDHPYSYTSNIAQFFVMIYLQDTHRENGCLRVIPGSHRKKYEPLSSLNAHSDELSEYRNPLSIQFQELNQEESVEVSMGDVIFGDARLLHGAYGNYSTEERSLLTLWYHPNYFDLPASIRATIWRLHNGIIEGVDTPINEGGISNWPEEDKLLLTTLIPRVEKDAPLKWNRIPNW